MNMIDGASPQFGIGNKDPVSRMAAALRPFWAGALTRQHDGNIDIDNEAAKQEVLGLAGEAVDLIINGQV